MLSENWLIVMIGYLVAAITYLGKTLCLSL